MGGTAGFDIDSQSGVQEPQPRHSYCSAVNPALYSAGTLQRRRNNSRGTEEMMGLVYLSCRMKMVAFKLNTHDGFGGGKEAFLTKIKFQICFSVCNI